MKTKDFYYDLPKELIAQKPLPNRSESRLLVMDRKTGAMTHTVFEELLHYVAPGDCLVMNDTRVIPARLIGKSQNGVRMEFLLLNRKDAHRFEVLVKPGKKARVGSLFDFGKGILKARILDITAEGGRLVEFIYDGIFEEILDKLGETPLPPYITEKPDDEKEIRNRYQTVYARQDGSAAAPTAGLHFTWPMLEALSEKGVDVAYITLHVGLGTFRPVKAENILDHRMHAEYFDISPEAADKINRAKKNGGRIIAVGTTSCRTLESAADELGSIQASRGWTDIFIYPGYKFKLIDGLITNFHLPESTLLMLISAFSQREHILAAYEEAVRQRYRFFSFGDCMLIQ